MSGGSGKTWKPWTTSEERRLAELVREGGQRLANRHLPLRTKAAINKRCKLLRAAGKYGMGRPA